MWPTYANLFDGSGGRQPLCAWTAEAGGGAGEAQETAVPVDLKQLGLKHETEAGDRRKLIPQSGSNWERSSLK